MSPYNLQQLTTKPLKESSKQHKDSFPISISLIFSGTNDFFFQHNINTNRKKKLGNILKKNKLQYVIDISKQSGSEDAIFWKTLFLFLGHTDFQTIFEVVPKLSRNKSSRIGRGSQCCKLFQGSLQSTELAWSGKTIDSFISRIRYFRNLYIQTKIHTV